MSMSRRDGLERIQVPEGATVETLKGQITETLNVPGQDITLSTNKDLVSFCECLLLSHASEGGLGWRSKRQVSDYSAHSMQLTALDKSSFTDMAKGKQSISSVGIKHGDMVSLHHKE